jgi:hypothetical protein
MPRPTFDRNSGRVVAKPVMVGLTALCGRVSRQACRHDETIPCDDDMSRELSKCMRFAVKRAVVVLLRASGRVQHCVVTAVANGIAQSGRVGLVGVIGQKTREFLDSAKSSLVRARDCHNRHTTSMRRKAAHIDC